MAEQILEVDEFDLAEESARSMQGSTPYALSARFECNRNCVVVRLSTRIEIAFSPDDVQGLEKATPEQLETIEISPSGFGLHFPALDADIYLPALLEGFLGSRAWMASRMGAEGGKARSQAKAEAARQNGRLGGRPRKNTAAA